MFQRKKICCSILSAIVIIVAGCQRESPSFTREERPANTQARPLPDNAPPALKRMLEGAIEQSNQTFYYDPAYIKIDYPGGDVPLERGVCTDVLIRAFRKGGVDLQKEVHEDMKKHFSVYPTKWGLTKPDSNIDHRRVPNLQTYFQRQGKELAITANVDDYKPGDVVAWDLGGGVDHIGIVTNLTSPETKSYLIVHNIGAGARIENVLFSWQITGHYRYF